MPSLLEMSAKINAVAFHKHSALPLWQRDRYLTDMKNTAATELVRLGSTAGAEFWSLDDWTRKGVGSQRYWLDSPWIPGTTANTEEALRQTSGPERESESCWHWGPKPKTFEEDSAKEEKWQDHLLAPGEAYVQEHKVQKVPKSKKEWKQRAWSRNSQRYRSCGLSLYSPDPGTARTDVYRYSVNVCWMTEGITKLRDNTHSREQCSSGGTLPGLLSHYTCSTDYLTSSGFSVFMYKMELLGAPTSCSHHKFKWHNLKG